MTDQSEESLLTLATEDDVLDVLSDCGETGLLNVYYFLVVILNELCIKLL